MSEEKSALQQLIEFHEQETRSLRIRANDFKREYDEGLYLSDKGRKLINLVLVYNSELENCRKGHVKDGSVRFLSHVACLIENTAGGMQ